MNWDIAESNWNHFQNTVRACWSRLNSDNLDLIAGKRVLLLGKLQEMYGMEEIDAESEIKAFERRCADYDAK